MSCARSTVQCFSSLLLYIARLGLQLNITVKVRLFCPRSTILKQLVSAAVVRVDQIRSAQHTNLICFLSILL